MTGVGSSCGRHCYSWVGSQGGSWVRWPACWRWGNGCQVGHRAAATTVGNLESSCLGASPVEDHPFAERTALRRTRWDSLGTVVAAAVEASHQIRPSYSGARNLPAFLGHPSQGACPEGNPRTAAAVWSVTRSTHQQAPFFGGRGTGQDTRLGHLGCSDLRAHLGPELPQPDSH